MGVARVLATKSDILTVEKTNNEAVRANTVTSVNKVLIGSVPDRGGRPMETRPPPEMPAFKARTTAPPQDQRGGGGGRGHNKGRVQGSKSLYVCLCDVLVLCFRLVSGQERWTRRRGLATGKRSPWQPPADQRRWKTKIILFMIKLCNSYT